MQIPVDPPICLSVQKLAYQTESVIPCSSRYSLFLVFSAVLEKLVCDPIITKTCPCNIQRFFSVVKKKMKISSEKKMIFFLFLLKAVLTSTHNLCFGAKIIKKDIPLHTPVFLYKSGVQGGIHYTDMFS